MRQEDLVQYLQRMLGLADLPVCNAPAFPQVSQKGLNILSESVFQRFFRQEIGKVFCPVHVEWGTIGSNPVFLRAPPVSFPKTVAPFGFWNIHDCYHRNPLNVKRLSKTEALYNR